MIFKQFRYEPLNQASYLIGCARAKECLIVDPIDDLGVDFYVMEAADLNQAIVGVLETHVHADYVSCARELAAERNCPHYLYRTAPTTYAFTPLDDDQVLRVGEVQVRALFTPGHTPEHTSYVVTDGARSDEPWAVLTGDSLFVGDVGRPDLLVGDQALDVMDEGQRAETQFRSIRERIFTLPDHVEVFPNHYGGSACGGVNMSGKASSTIYFEKKFNLALAQPDAAAFAAFVKETARPLPDDYARIKSYNLGLLPREALAAPVREASDAAAGASRPMSPVDVQAAQAAGAAVLDLRTPKRFADEHLEGAVNLQFNRADLVDRAEMVLPMDLPLVTHGDPDAIGEAAARLLEEGGFTVLGHLDGGLEAWKAAGLPTATLPTLDVDRLHAELDAWHVVDARDRFEWKFARVPGASLLPWTDAWERAGAFQDPGQPVAVICGDEVRSSLVASILARLGHRPSLVMGGMVDWLDRAYPQDKGDA